MNAQTIATIDATLNLADQISRMRGQADQCVANFQTRDRGFFSPTEDDQVTQLWTSYIKSRWALLETIVSLRSEFGNVYKNKNEVERNSAAEFLVGYATALILVDAARTLRDRFAGDALVRRKLNESYESFGIQAGTFDAIQLSLTKPANALGVRDAGEFYLNHEAAFREFAQQSTELIELIAVIDGLRSTIAVTAADYVRSRLADRKQQIRHQWIRGNATKAIYAIQQWGSKLVSNISTNPAHVSIIPSAIVRSLNPLIRPGDVFVTRKECAVTNYFLPGFWPHAAMYVGNDQVVESLKDGVRVRNMDSPLGNDCLAVIRPTLTEPEIGMAIDRAHQHVGKPYDFDFDFTRSDRMVCTEVVYRSYQGIGGIEFELTKRAGRHTLSAEDLLALAIRSHHFEVVTVYCPGHSKTLCQGTVATEILRDTVANKT
jgi:uncharacterized protein YycO